MELFNKDNLTIEIDLNKETQILEKAFDRTGIPKYNTCTLWACLASSKLWDVKRNQYAYPVLGTMTFMNKITNEKGHYDQRNNSFHVATLLYTNQIWYLVDFSANYLISSNFKMTKLPVVPIVIPILALQNTSPNETNELMTMLKELKPLSVEEIDYSYSFDVETILAQLTEQNEYELRSLENQLGLM